MKRLDPVTAQMFPTVAAHERRARRFMVAALICIVVSAFIIGRDVLSAYQLRVAQENMSAMVGRVAALEDQYQRDHPGLRVTKAHAQTIVAKIEKDASGK